MHWLPTYMKAHLNADHKEIMYTAAPYIFNSIFGVRKSLDDIPSGSSLTYDRAIFSFFHFQFVSLPYHSDSLVHHHTKFMLENGSYGSFLYMRIVT